jgi:hypothetical protein
MAPVKFDDLPKTAGSILDDDYQTSGWEFSSKQKTNWNSAVASTTVNLFGKDSVQTPAKIGWKIPAPLGLAGFTVDKLEMDKAGKFKLETSLDKGLHSIDGLKVEVKSDLENVSKITCASTFTGIADTQIKLDAPITKPEAFTLDLTRSVQQVTLGVKCGMANIAAPDVGARFATGPLFVSLLLKNKLSAITAHAAYTASPELKIAATCVKAKDLKGAVGLEYKVSSDTTVKAKIQEDKSVSASVKSSLVKGFTLTAGGKYELTGKLAYGLKLSVE